MLTLGVAAFLIYFLYFLVGVVPMVKLAPLAIVSPACKRFRMVASPNVAFGEDTRLEDKDKSKSFKVQLFIFIGIIAAMF